MWLVASPVAENMQQDCEWLPPHDIAGSICGDWYVLNEFMERVRNYVCDGHYICDVEECKEMHS